MPLECHSNTTNATKGRLDQITLGLRQVGVDAHSVFVAGRAYQDIVRMAKRAQCRPGCVSDSQHTDYTLEDESKSNEATV